MAFDVTIEVGTTSSRGLSISSLVALAERVMLGEECGSGASLSCLLTDDPALRSLNRQFLGIDEPTDVLAFPDDADSDFILGQSDGLHVGDIAISIERADSQAADAGHSLEDEISHLLVHGILHLCGYDHAAGAEEELRMKAREEHYLGEVASHGDPS